MKGMAKSQYLFRDETFFSLFATPYSPFASFYRASAATGFSPACIRPGTIEGAVRTALGR